MAIKNAKNFKDYDKETLKAISRKGGKNLRINNQRRKTFRDTMIIMLEKPLTKKERAIYEEMYPGQLGDVKTMQDIITLAANIKASKGDVRALEVLRDSIGEKPKEQKEIEHKGEIVHRVTQIDLDERISKTSC